MCGVKGMETAMVALGILTDPQGKDPTEREAWMETWSLAGVMVSTTAINTRGMGLIPTQQKLLT